MYLRFFVSMKRGIRNNLTKDFILSRVSQEEIFAKYLQIPIDTIYDCINHNSLISSPLRYDENESFGFRYGHNNKQYKLRARDFGGYFWGDCFDLVAYIMSRVKDRQYNVAVKNDFYEVLKNIAITFKDKVYGKNVNQDELNTNLSGALKLTLSTKHIVEVVPRQFDMNDIKLWNKWHLTQSDLERYGIYAVEQYYIDRYSQPEPKYYYTRQDPCYCYVLGVDNNGVYNIKLYFPLRKQFRFITNCTILEGLDMLDDKDYDCILITEATKDRVAIDNIIKPFLLQGDLKIGIINIPSASYTISKSEYEYLQSKLLPTGIIIFFGDNDPAGRKAARIHNEKYDIPYIFISRGHLGSTNYGAKDFCELLELYSLQTVTELVEKTVKLFFLW